MMLGQIITILILGAVLTFFTRPKGVQISPTSKKPSGWVCKDCNESFTSDKRDSNCPKCGSKNVWRI